MTKFSDYKYLGLQSWREMWKTVAENNIRTMVSNLNADLQAGYDLLGSSVTYQREEISFRIIEYKRQLSRLDGEQDLLKAERWCFDDLRKRGYIE